MAYGLGVFGRQRNGIKYLCGIKSYGNLNGGNGENLVAFLNCKCTEKLKNCDDEHKDHEDPADGQYIGQVFHILLNLL